jgi:hypothetical protein
MAFLKLVFGMLHYLVVYLLVFIILSFRLYILQRFTAYCSDSYHKHSFFIRFRHSYGIFRRAEICTGHSETLGQCLAEFGTSGWKSFARANNKKLLSLRLV